MSAGADDKQVVPPEHLEKSSVKSIGIDGELLHPDVRESAEKALVRKLDTRLMPTIISIFLMNYIDRTSVTAARLKGLEHDLGLTPIQYSTVLAILYVSYVPAQVPSNMIFNWISRPSFYLSLCVILWGLVSAMTGVTKSFTGIVACRVFIGLPEASFYPGAIYLLSRWYTKKELSFRASLLYGGFLVSNAVGSLMAAGILSNMDYKRGIRAWRWLFYIEGTVTICIGFIAVITLPDYPHNTRWLTPAERRLAQVRLAEDAGEADEDVASESPLLGLKMALKDPKVLVFALMGCSQALGLSFINFFPSLTATLGFGTTVTLLLAAPPWILATIVCCLNAWHADKTGERYFHIVVWWLVSIVGFIIGVSTLNTGARYVSIFLMTLGLCGSALILVWVSNVVPRPPAKRSAAIGVVSGFANVGILMGSYVWKASWAPAYRQPMSICIGAFVLSLSLAFVIRWMIIRENKMLERGELGEIAGANKERIEDAAKLEGVTLEEAIQKKRGFRYLY